MDDFTAHLGLQQGRLIDTQGRAVFVLGAQTLGWRADLAAGDFVEVAQDADLTAITLIRVDGALEMRGVAPQHAWEVTLRIDDAVYATLRGRPHQTRALHDVAACVVDKQGVHKVALRLSLVEV